MLGRLFEFARENDLTAAGPHFILHYDEKSFGEGEADIQVCLPVDLEGPMDGRTRRAGR